MLTVKKERNVRRVVLIAAVSAMSVGMSAASGQVWTGGAGDGLMGSAGNWNGGMVPTSGGTTVLTFGGASGYSAVNDLGSQPFVVNGLSFDGASGVISLSGGAFELSGESPSVTQTGLAGVNVSSGLTLGATTTLAGAGGAVTFSGAVTSVDSVGLVKGGLADLVLGGTGNSFGYLQVNAGTATFSGGTHTLSSTTAAPSVGGASAPTVSLTAGNASGQAGVINIEGGAVVGTKSIFVGNAAGASGVLNVSGAGTRVTTDLATFALGRVGVFEGTGRVSVSGGASVTGLSFELGRGATGVNATATFTGSGTTANFQQVLSGVANSQLKLEVLDGAVFTNSGGNNSSFNAGANSTMSITVSGAGSVFQNTGSNTSIILGSGANSTTTMEISNGGLVSAPTFLTGGGAGGNTTVTVGSGGILRTTSVMSIGTAGGQVSSLRILDGGTLDLSGTTQFRAASGTNAAGGVTVVAGGTINVASTALFYIGNGIGTQGHVLLDGGTLNNSSTTTLGSGFTGSSTDGANNAFTIQNGGKANLASTVFIGRNVSGTNASTATVLVTGAGSLYNITGNVTTHVGYSRGATGSFTVRDGATANIAILTAGSQGAPSATDTFATGSVTFTGLGTTVTATQAQIGSTNFARGSLVISDGAGVAVSGLLYVGSGQGSVSRMALENASLSVGGSLYLGSGQNAVAQGLVDQGTLSVTGTLVLGNNLSGSISDGSDARLVIRNGSVVSAATNIFVGRNLGGSNATTASLTVSGSGTTLTQTAGTLSVGPSRGNTSSLLVDQGASVTAAAFSLGNGAATSASDSFSTATATFTGGGTKANINGQLSVGGGAYSQANMIVSDGARVTVTGTSFIASAQNAVAQINVAGGGTLVTNAIQLGSNGGSVGGTGTLTVGIGGAVESSLLILGTPGTISMTGGTITASHLLEGTNTSTGLVTLDAGTMLLTGSSVSEPGSRTTGASLRGTAGTLVIDSPNLTQVFSNRTNTFGGDVVVRNGGVNFTGSSAGTTVQLSVESVSVGAGASVSSPAKMVLLSPNLGSTGSRVRGNVIVVGSLDIAGGTGGLTGFIDLQDNDMVISEGSEAVIAGYVSQWWNDGLRNGNGLGSSLAGKGVGIDELATLAVVTNVLPGGGARFQQFNALTGLDSNDVLVKYTYLGDADLSGQVDAEDIAAVLAGIRSNGTLTGWANGDFNYDGLIDSNDLAILLKVRALQGASFGPAGSAGGTSIPEPGGLGVVVAMCAAMGRRRRGQE